MFYLLNSAWEQQIQGDIPRANQTGGMSGMGGDSGGGQTAVEVMVPGNKVGLVIGKGGETIRQLQVGCRLTWGKQTCLPLRIVRIFYGFGPETTHYGLIKKILRKSVIYS